MLDFSIVVFFIVIGLDLQRYNLFFNIQIFLYFFYFFCDGLRCRFADYERLSYRFAVYETTRQQVYKWLPPWASLSLSRLRAKGKSRKGIEGIEGYRKVKKGHELCRLRYRFAVYETTRLQDYKWLPRYSLSRCLVVLLSGAAKRSSIPVIP